MIPNPLHPAIVHFPVVFAVLLPLVAVGALWFIRRGVAPRRAWAFPVAMAAALALSSFLAVQTGDAQKDRVERVIGDRPVDEHEEAAELFLVLSCVFLVVAATGLAPGLAGRSARIVASVGALGLLAAGYRVGASGGELVYRHGAASVYAADAAPGGPAESNRLDREGSE